MAPHITHLTQADYQISQWSGGTTTQIAIAPQGPSMRTGTSSGG